MGSKAFRYEMARKRGSKVSQWRNVILGQSERRAELIAANGL